MKRCPHRHLFLFERFLIPRQTVCVYAHRLWEQHSVLHRNDDGFRIIKFNPALCKGVASATPLLIGRNSCSIVLYYFLSKYLNTPAETSWFLWECLVWFGLNSDFYLSLAKKFFCDRAISYSPVMRWLKHTSFTFVEY